MQIAFILFLVTLFTIPLETISFGSLGGTVGSLSLPQLLGMASFILIFLGNFVAKSRRGLYSFSDKDFFLIGLLFLGFIFFEIFSSRWNGSPVSSLSIVRSRIMTLMLLSLPILHVRIGCSVNKEIKILVAYILCSVLAALTIFLVAFGFITFSSARMDNLDRMNIDAIRNAGILKNYGDIAVIFSVSFSSMLYLCKIAPRYKLFCFISFAFLTVGIVLSQSRNVWLACLVSVTIYCLALLVKKKKRTYNRLFVKFFVSSFFCLVGVFLYGNIEDIIISVISFREASILSRLDMYLAGLRAYLNSPLLGVGADGFLYYDLHVHNIILIAFLRAGLGAVFFISVFLIMIWGCMKRLPSPRYSFVFSSICGFLSSTLFYPAIVHASPTVWLTFGLIISFYLNKKM